MDSYRGHFPDEAGGYDPLDLDDADIVGEDDDIGRELPPSPVGQDERRMQVRAYNHWASLLGTQAFPRLQDLSLEAMPDLATFAVILDFSDGIEDPRITWLGTKLAEECGAEQPLDRLSDVPSRSLLSRITDHYMQILANEAPIGFEAEFVSQRNRTVVYRGILLPFADDGATIRQILGVINWKELADQAMTDALLAEIDKALAEAPAPTERLLAEPEPEPTGPVPAPAWSEAPTELPGFEVDRAVLDLAAFGDLPFPEILPDAPLPGLSMPTPLFGADDPANLAGWLASARALALAAASTEERSHAALYAAVGRAWDFALAAEQAPGELAELLAENGLTTQARAPLTPIVKLVFGAEYDKTRLAEYATALAQAQRLGLGQGQLADHLMTASGGLKGVVQVERKLKREARGEPVLRKTPRPGLARKLRKIAPRRLDEFTGDGEFAVLLARRLENGELVLLGEAGDDVALVEKVARKVLG